MLGKRARKTVVVAIGLAAAFSLTACNGDGDDGAAPAASSEGQSAGSSNATGSSGSGSKGPTGSSGSGSSGSGSSGSGSSGSGSSGSSAGQGAGDAKAGTCRTDALQVEAADNTTGKKEGVVTVSFKNTGGDCVVNGFAGADLKTADGSSISLDRNGEATSRDVIKTGELAAFNIYFPVNDSGGSGVRPTKIVVTPPNETKSVTVSWPAGSLPASDSPDGTKLEISPVHKVG
ncbi:DUF4232 domain-containing protein [Streptomyces sp. NPDC047985]|uniref:DUF4232 domain-containing protein n=1 Tax=Streptomyces sp. NPDC047985 TaxID=3155384 RepID=UPI00343C7427